MRNEVWEQVVVRQIVEAVNRSSLFAAMARFLAGDLRETIHECSECIFDPDTSLEAEYAAFFLRGWSLYLSGDPQNAVHDLSIWINRESDGGDTANGYQLRAACYESLGDWENALDDLDTALDQIGETAPEAVKMLYRRGQLQLTIGSQESLDGAIDDFSTVIERENSLLAYLHRGKAALALTDYPAAVSDFNRVLEMDPTNSLAHELNGTVALLNLNTEDAKELFEAARLYCDEFPGEVRIDLFRGAVAYLGEDYGTALDLLKTVEDRIGDMPAGELAEIQRKMQLLEDMLFRSKPVRVEGLMAAWDALWRRIRDAISDVISQETPALVPA